MKKIFIGRDGLRAGWRFLLWWIIFFGLRQVLILAIVRLFHPQETAFLDPVGLLVDDLIVLVPAAIATWIMMHIERRRLRDYYWPTYDFFGRQFWLGLAWGLAAISLNIGLIALAGGYCITGLATTGGQLAKFVLLWIAASFAIGIVEEFVFRAYQLRTLADGMGFWPAALLTSCAFGALHYFTKPYERWEDWVSVSFIALFLCFSVRRTGTLAFAIGLHISFDWGAIFFYSGRNAGQFAPGRLFLTQWPGSDHVTGGLLGPEASWMMGIVLLAMFVIYDRVSRRPAGDALA